MLENLTAAQICKKFLALMTPERPNCVLHTLLLILCHESHYTVHIFTCISSSSGLISTSHLRLGDILKWYNNKH